MFRFKTKEVADEFKAMFDSCKNEIQERKVAPVVTAAPAVAAAPAVTAAPAVSTTMNVEKVKQFIDILWASSSW